MSPTVTVPRVGRLLPGEHPEQRGLAGAVRADDADDAGAGQGERQVVDEEPVAVALRQVLHLDHLVAEAGPGRDGDLEPVAAAGVGLGLGPQLLVGRQPGPALGLAGLGRHPHPLQLALQGALAGRRLLLLVGQPGLLLVEPRRVVALEREAPAAVELEDPLGHVVEEVAVVGDGHDRARVLLQEPLQPVDRLGVEVVGGLVEEQQVGVGEQQPAQRHPAPLAARQRGHVGVVGRAAQGVHGDLDVAVEVPRVGGVDLVLQLGLEGAHLLVVGVGVAPHGHDLVVPVEEGPHRGHAVEHVADHVLGRVELRLLGEEAGAEARREAGLTAEAVVEAGHDPQEGGLAGAVGPDHADLGAGVERQRDALQHGRGRAGRTARACAW